jgi:protein gp37
MSSKILWCDETWNPVTGCTPISEGCRNCYAKRMARRLAGRYGYPKDDPFKVTFHPERLEQPQRWKKPKRIFTCSMADLFHEDVKSAWITDILTAMAAATQHTYIVLTKRPARMRDELNDAWRPYFPPWLWVGVTAENQHTFDERWASLRATPAAVVWISYEPVLAPLVLPADFLDRGRGAWVVCGGETGPGARPMRPDWARGVRDQCQAAGVPFVFKGWGEWRTEEFPPATTTVVTRVGRRRAGRLLDGREWNQIPETLRRSSAPPICCAGPVKGASDDD